MGAMGPRLVALALLSAAAPAQEPARPKPNIVLVMADDLGAAELGCYGSTKHATPNLDRLAAGGVRFETAFAACVCRPTRIMLFTGQYGCHNGVYNFDEKRGGPTPEVSDITGHLTFAQLLKGAGYTTALCGKWQLSGTPPTMLHEAGFDEYLIWAQEGRYLTPEQHAAAQKAGIKARTRYWRPRLSRNGEWIPTDADTYGPDVFTDFAIDFMGRHRDEPFLLYFPMALTHDPFRPTPASSRSPEDRGENSFQEHFRANVEYVDVLIGRLDRALAELDLRDHTLLLFTGDNGTWGRGKAQPTELGARVPMIASGPGIVRRRGATGELTDLSDVLPTLCDFAGVPVPDDRPIDGVSLGPFLRGESEHTRPWIFSFIADRRILRTQRWLLEDDSPLHAGRLYDCGGSRDGTGYRDVTDSDDPEVAAARARFAALLEELPAPVLPSEGPPNQPKKKMK